MSCKVLVLMEGFCLFLPFFDSIFLKILIQFECKDEETVPTFKLYDNFKTKIMYSKFVF